MLPAIYFPCGSPLHASVAGCVRSPERPPRPRRHPACEPACAPVGDEQGLVARAGVAGAGSEGGRVWASEGPTPAERRTHARTLATPSGLQRSSSDVSLFITRRVPRPPPQRGRLPPPWAQRVMRGIACARKLDRAAGPRWQRCDRAPRWGSSFFYPSSFSCAAKRYREKIVWCGRCFEDVFPPRARDHQPASGGGLAVPATSDRSGERASARGLPQSALAPPASPHVGGRRGQRCRRANANHPSAPFCAGPARAQMAGKRDIHLRYRRRLLLRQNTITHRVPRREIVARRHGRHWRWGELRTSAAARRGLHAARAAGRHQVTLRPLLRAPRRVLCWPYECAFAGCAVVRRPPCVRCRHGAMSTCSRARVPLRFEHTARCSFLRWFFDPVALNASRSKPTTLRRMAKAMPRALALQLPPFLAR